MPASSTPVHHHVCLHGEQSEKPPLLFVHGFGTDHSTWGEVADAFANERQGVCFDNIGTGRSDPRAFQQHRYLNLRQYGLDIISLCGALELKRPVLVGHSAGGMMALIAAVERPDLFSGLVMAGASPRYVDAAGYRGGFTEQDLQRTYSAVIRNYPDWVAEFAPAAIGNPDRPDLAHSFAEALRTLKPQHALTVLCSILQTDERDLLDRVRTPTLVLQTRQDPFVPAEVAQYLQDHIPGAQRVLIDTQGHFPHLTAADQVIHAVREFVHTL